VLFNVARAPIATYIPASEAVMDGRMVTLTEDDARLATQLVAEGRYSSADEVVQAAMDALRGAVETDQGMDWGPVDWGSVRSTSATPRRRDTGTHLPSDPGPCGKLVDASQARAGPDQGWSAGLPAQGEPAERSPLHRDGRQAARLHRRADRRTGGAGHSHVRGRGMLNANVEREARASEADDKNGSLG
jgi:hypothetical protein